MSRFEITGKPKIETDVSLPLEDKSGKEVRALSYARFIRVVGHYKFFKSSMVGSSLYVNSENLNSENLNGESPDSITVIITDTREDHPELDIKDTPKLFYKPYDEFSIRVPMESSAFEAILRQVIHRKSEMVSVIADVGVLRTDFEFMKNPEILNDQEDFDGFIEMPIWSLSISSE